jgi:hypothetical protein
MRLITSSISWMRCAQVSDRKAGRLPRPQSVQKLLRRKRQGRRNPPDPGGAGTGRVLRFRCATARGPGSSSRREPEPEVSASGNDPSRNCIPLPVKGWRKPRPRPLTAYPAHCRRASRVAGNPFLTGSFGNSITRGPGASDPGKTRKKRSYCNRGRNSIFTGWFASQ